MGSVGDTDVVAPENSIREEEALCRLYLMGWYSLNFPGFRFFLRQARSSYPTLEFVVPVIFYDASFWRKIP